MTDLIQKLTASLVIATVTAPAAVAGGNHATGTPHHELPAMSYADYMAQVRIVTNANRELPDLNFGGWRALSWGSAIPENVQTMATQVADATVTSTRRTFQTTADGRLSGVTWRSIGATKPLQSALGPLIALYGEPSDTLADGTRIWRGTQSILTLSTDDQGISTSVVDAHHQ